MSTNYGFEPTLDGLNNIDADSSTATNIICDTIQINTSGTAPTRAPADNSTNIATTAYVDNATTGVFVDLTTTQTITGEKTFINANTLITGNLVVNSILSASATTDINIGQNLTTGDIFMGTSVSTGVALNWGSSSNGGNLTFRGGTFNFFGSGLIYLRGGPTFEINLGDTQTSGILNIATSSSRTGAVNIATGATTTSTAISIGNQTGAFGSCDIGTTTITVGKANTATNSMQTSTNGTLNLKTTSTGGNVNLGTGMTSGNIFISGGSASATNILIGSSQTTYTGSIAIGTVVTGNAPITIGSSASSTQTALHNALTTFKKLVVVDDGILQRWGQSTTGLTLGKTNINEITCKLLNSADTLYFQTSTATSIMYINETEIINAIPTTFSSTTTHTGGATFNGTATFNNNILIQQSTYPSTNTSQLGYNKTETLAEFTFTADTLGTIGSFTVPSKGVWSCSISVKYRTTGGAGSFENVQLFLTDSASGTTAYRTFEYFDETDVTVGSNGKRFVHTISGTLNTTTSTIFYIRGLNDTTGITTLAEAIYSYTRVG
jgi:hypothetical protein